MKPLADPAIRNTTDPGWRLAADRGAPLSFPTSATVYAGELTDRERTVLAHIAAGRTLEEAAQQLGVSRNTAHTHLKHIYDKLGICNRVEAVVAAARLQLIRL